MCDEVRAEFARAGGNSGAYLCVSTMLVPLVSSVRIAAPREVRWWPRARAWSARAVLTLGAVIVLVHLALPALVAWRIERALAGAGFPDARVHVAHVGWRSLRLDDVTLAPGLALGDVELDGGVSSLVGGDGPTTATIHGARADVAALARIAMPGGGGGGGDETATPPPVQRVVVDGAEVRSPNGAITIDATIDLPGRTRGARLAIDAVARTATWRLGPITLRDVAVTARGAGDRVHVCADAGLAGATAEACTDVPSGAAALRRLRALDVALTATAPTGAALAWSARGHATIAWSAEGPITITGGHLDGALPARDAGGLAATPIALRAELSGSLSPLALDVVGDARAERVEWKDGKISVVARGLAAPFALRAGPSGLVARRALALSADDAVVSLPGVTLPLAHPTAIVADAGAPLALDARALRLAGGHAGALGGELSIDPVAITPGAASHLVVHARAIRLEQLLALIGKGYVVGAGPLDGEATIELAPGRTTIVGAALRARTPGVLRVVDKTWRDYALGAIPDFAIHRRIAGALADFDYGRLTAVLGPPGADPELRVELHGRGRAVDQELDLTINLRNVRETIGALP
jgi:hypothetical protein